MTGTATRRHTAHDEDARSTPLVLTSTTGASTSGWRSALGHALGTAVSVSAAALMVTGLTAIGATTTVTGLVSFLRTN
ncbi:MULTISPECIES: hypothetical protein [Rhodococcus]|uniref:hypothetical protein n=1 Tax=Rhodococcus TaxID=1827 RepID=UPI0005C137C8|nr:MULTISPECIES: hypothetical protein [Rhodococcus]NGP27792.1 hypothetical protein [Rhodococcus aetherivorans]QRI79190.1 hypothetical protein JQ505_00765 [Rhodococcus aetherivorans]QSE62398.1 hypothetical protein JYA75_01880 [Rhodococcus sp. PSBB066]QSE72186.1 hypothetical protein JYA91_25715 [Rhodococcus sp. PSBB049]UGQ40866.1 hypothetical protein LRQ66_22420 [Rhodococcus aetherivorans]